MDYHYRLISYVVEVEGIDYLSLFLENDKKDADCWGVFMISVLNHMDRVLSERIGFQHLGWTNYMDMQDFLGYVVDNTVSFSVSFDVIEELN